MAEAPSAATVLVEADLRKAGAVAVYQDPADLRRQLAEVFRLRAATGGGVGGEG